MAHFLVQDNDHFETEMEPADAMPSRTAVTADDAEEPVQAGMGGIPLLFLAGLGLFFLIGKRK